MPINDVRQVEYNNKRIKLNAGSFLDPCQAGPHKFDDFTHMPVVMAGGIGHSDFCRINQSGTASVDAVISATAGAPVAGHGGWLAGSVDNVDNEIDEVALGSANWLFPAALPTGGLIVAEAGLVLPAITARLIFFGLSGNASTATADGPISIVTGVTLVDGSAGGDAAGFVFSSLATDTDAWYTGTVKATSVGTAYNTTAGTSGTAMDVITADDYTRLRVEVDVDGDVYFYSGINTALARGAVPLEFRHAVSAAVTAADGFSPIMSTASTETTAVVWEIDYMFGAATHA